MANLQRRAGEYASDKAKPIAEKIRTPDLTKVRSVAAYGVTLPVVKGKHRVGGTVIAVSPTHALYALCEGPVAGVRQIYRSDKGSPLPDISGWYVLAGGSTQTIPSVYGFSGFGRLMSSYRGTCCVIGPLEGGRPLDVSFEVATSDGDQAATRTLAYNAPDGSSPASWTPAQMSTDAQADGTGGSAPWEGTGPWAENLYATDMDVAVHVDGSGNTVRDAAWWHRTSMTIWWSRKVGAGAWSSPVSIHGSLAPQTNSRPQVKIVADASEIHVAWARSSQAVSSAEVVHAWSSNGGGSWSRDTVTRAARASTNYGSGIYHLSLSRAAGTVWISFSQKTSVFVAGPVGSGFSGGFTVAAKAGSGAWAYPPTNALAGLDRELSIQSNGFGWELLSTRIIGASIVGIDATTAQMAIGWNPPNVSPSHLTYLCARVKLSGGSVLWDHTAGYHSILTGGAVLSSDWVVANLSTRPTILPSGTGSTVYGATEIIAIGGGKFAVAWMEPTSNAYDTENRRVPWAWKSCVWTGSAWEGPVWAPPADGDTLVRRLSLSYDGTYIYACAGSSCVVGDAAFASDRITQYKGLDLSVMAKSFTYRPETSDGNDLITRYVCIGDGELATTETSDLTNDGVYSTALVHVTRSPVEDDLLPGDLIRHLIAHRTQGARISSDIFDADTWARFDAYCQAKGIYFSLAVTEQSSALAMACEIAESANAMVYYSAGAWKIAVRETASITANGATYTPRPEHAASCMVIDENDLRKPLQIKRKHVTDRRNVLPVTYRDRSRSYQDVTIELQDLGAMAANGPQKAQAQSWPWVTRGAVASTCGVLRLRREIRDIASYSFEAPQKYLALEVGDLVTVRDTVSGIPARVVRITRIEDDGAWISITAEHTAVYATEQPEPDPVIPGPLPSAVAPAVNPPIVFAAPPSLTGAGTEIWCLLSWPDGTDGVRVQASTDGGETWGEAGVCSSESPTGWLMAASENLTPRTDLAPHGGLRPGLFDRFTAVDMSESELPFPVPLGTQWADELPGALLWVDGELIAYRRLISDLPDQLRHGCHGTTAAWHSLPSRLGVVTSAAFRWVPPAGSGGASARLRFISLAAPSYIDQADAAGTTVTIAIPAGV